MAKFEKGKSGNPAGRPKGSPDKNTKEFRQAISDFLEGKFDEVIQTWCNMKEGRDKLNFYRDLLQYRLPRLRSIDLSFDLERLTEDELDVIINRLKNSLIDE